MKPSLSPPTPSYKSRWPGSFRTKPLIKASTPPSTASEPAAPTTKTEPIAPRSNAYIAITVGVPGLLKARVDALVKDSGGTQAAWVRGLIEADLLRRGY